MGKQGNRSPPVRTQSWAGLPPRGGQTAALSAKTPYQTERLRPQPEKDRPSQIQISPLSTFWTGMLFPCLLYSPLTSAPLAWEYGDGARMLRCGSHGARPPWEPHRSLTALASHYPANRKPTTACDTTVIAPAPFRRECRGLAGQSETSVYRRHSLQIREEPLACERRAETSAIPALCGGRDPPDCDRGLLPRQQGGDCGVSASPPARVSPKMPWRRWNPAESSACSRGRLLRRNSPA